MGSIISYISCLVGKLISAAPPLLRQRLYERLHPQYYSDSRCLYGEGSQLSAHFQIKLCVVVTVAVTVAVTVICATVTVTA
jgi:hypothetical protein